MSRSGTPLVSVVIPTYECERLSRAVNSVLMQTYSPIEVTIVDDGSVSCTARSSVEHLDGIRLLSQHNAGVASARNTGLASASGKYVAFLDADDEFLPDKIQEQVSLLEGSNLSGMVYSKWRTVDLHGAYLHEAGIDMTGRMIPRLLYRNIAQIGSCLFLTDAVRAIGGFDPSVGGVEDWDLYLRLVIGGYDIVFLPRVTSLYRLHQNGLSSNRIQMCDDAIRWITHQFLRRDNFVAYRSCLLHALVIQILDTMRRSIGAGEEQNCQILVEKLDRCLREGVYDDRTRATFGPAFTVASVGEDILRRHALQSESTRLLRAVLDARDGLEGEIETRKETHNNEAANDP